MQLPESQRALVSPEKAVLPGSQRALWVPEKAVLPGSQRALVGPVKAVLPGSQRTLRGPEPVLPDEVLVSREPSLNAACCQELRSSQGP
jgi:hypothetical protein